MKKLIVVLVALISCFVGISPSNAQQNRVFIYRGTQDNFSREISFPGLQNSKNNFLALTSQYWQIRGWVDKQSREVAYQLYIDASYSGDWQFYERAANDQAQDLEVKQISRTVGSCSYGCRLTEILGVSLTEEVLVAKALTGFQIKVFGRSGGSFILDVTPAQIQSALLTANQFIPEDRQWKSPTASTALPATTTSPNGLEAVANPLVPSVLNYGEWGYGQVTTIAYTFPMQSAIEHAKSQLVSEGWTIRSQSDNSIITEAKLISSNNSNADCGKAFGIPYLSGRLVSTMGFLTLNFEENKVLIKPAIAGSMRVTNGSTKPLTCLFKDVSLLSAIVASYQGK